MPAYLAIIMINAMCIGILLFGFNVLFLKD
jgi:hypothetical protein